MWNKPGVHFRRGDRHLIVQIAMPDHRRRHNPGWIETPGPRIDAGIGDGAADALAQRFPEIVEDGDAEARRKHSAVGFRQMSEAQQRAQEPG